MSAMSKKRFAAAALLVLVLSTVAALTGGCKADPHDTHISTGVSAPR